MAALPLIKAFRSRWDALVLLLIIAGFVFVASDRLGTVPVPQTDESYTLQVPYEMLNRGKLSLPMYRFLGGNIENVWHSYTPLYFVILSGFFKVFGWGLAEGRAFNLISAVTLLGLVYLIGRRLFDWRVALVAVVTLVSDQTFLERSRLLRNDFAAASFAMLAFFLYELAESRKRGSLYIASGLAAGAGVMCHTNILYMLVAVFTLMLLRNGWRVFKQRGLYQFGLSALVVMSYEIVYDLIDYHNFVLQNREDRLHFGVLNGWGVFENLIGEGRRYLKWYAGGEMFLNVPRTTLHIVQLLAICAILYLVVRSIYWLKQRAAIEQPAVRLLVVTASAVLFHALITSHKDIYYLAHLVPWFALCVGVMLRDVYEWLQRPGRSDLARARIIQRAAVSILCLGILAFGIQLGRQYKRYLREIRNPELASFEEIKTVLREIVPNDVCPVAIKSPVLWLAFPEKDYCFASIERRMSKNVDLEGNEYAILMPAAYHTHRAPLTKEFDARYKLLGDLHSTPYGHLRVYYTGTNPEVQTLPTQEYHFFGRQRGFVSASQIAQGREVWSRDFANSAIRDDESGLQVDQGRLAIPPGQTGGDLGTIEVEQQGVYQALLEVAAAPSRWTIRVVDGGDNRVLRQDVFGGDSDPRRIEVLFKTGVTNRVRLLIQSTGRTTPEPLRVSRISIRKI